MDTKITYIKDKNIEYITFDELDKYEELVCAFTTNKSSFRIVNDEDINLINGKYELLMQDLEASSYVVPKQTHSNNVYVLQDERGIYPENLVNVDAVVTNKKGVMLSLVFADCTPIMLYDKKKKVVACVHSGWRGTLNSIVTETIKKMESEFNCNLYDIICLIGPTIRKCHFEVDDDVKTLFYEKYNYLPNINEIIKKGEIKDDMQKYLIDTVTLNKTIMKNLGILEENIIDCNICTVCKCDTFHSHRKFKDKAGRSTLVVMLK